MQGICMNYHSGLAEASQLVRRVVMRGKWGGREGRGSEQGQGNEGIVLEET